MLTIYSIDLQFSELNDLIISKINFHQGATAINKYGQLLASLDYLVYEVDQSRAVPDFIHLMVREKCFIKYVSENKPGGIKGRSKPEFIESLEIPLPSLDEQADIVKKIERQNAIIEGVEKVEKNIEFFIPESQNKRILGDFIKDSLYGLSSKLTDKGKIPVLRMNNLDVLGRWFLNDLKYTDNNLSHERILEYGDFVFNRTNSIDLVGKSSVVDFDFNASWAGYLIRLKLSEDLNPFYLKYLFTNERYREYFKRTCKPAGGQANINADELASLIIDYYDLEVQNKIVSELNKKMQVLEGLQMMKTEAQSKINQILADIWGVEFNEPEKVEAEDEQEN